jgi:type II secretion system protein J
MKCAAKSGFQQSPLRQRSAAFSPLQAALTGGVLDDFARPEAVRTMKRHECRAPFDVVSPRRKDRHTATPAFTLLEVLLALAIAAIVLAALNTVFFSAMRMRATTTAMVQTVLPSDRAVSVMKADLAGIVPVGVMAGPMGSDIAGVGMTQPAALEIYTSTGVLSADAPWGPIQKIDYSLQDPTNRMTSNGRDLVRGVTRNLLAVTPPAPDQQVLIGDVQSLKFSYYDGTNWNESWSAVLSNTPVAIRVSIDFTPSRSDLSTSPPIQFVVPIYAQARTNQSQTLD